MQDVPTLQIPGVFSTQSKIPKRMDGVRVRAYSHKIYWYAEYDANGGLSIQPLNAEMLPSGVKLPISLVELAGGYDPEPAVYERKVLPKMRQFDGILEKADEYREENKNARAACEYRRALAMDEENIRANFGAGLTYLAQGETGKAGEIFRRLLGLQGTFEERHKHMFNEFGISMRKNKMFQEAVEYYGRALELTKDDENLHINIARPLCEQKKFAACTQHLIQALRLAPGNKTAVDFLAWMKCKDFIPLHLQLEVEKALNVKPGDESGEGECVLPDELFE